MKRRITWISLFIVVMFIISCAPNSLYMTGGEQLDELISENKTKVAVLPAVDWSEESGFCKGYMLYGCWGALSSDVAYDDGGAVVTNSLAKELWKKNRMELIEKSEIISKMDSLSFTADEIFPKHKSTFLGLHPKPVASPTDVGKGIPNYEKLYTLGDALGTDIILLSRMTRNEETRICTQSPMGAFPPLSTLINVGYWYYRDQIKEERNSFIVLDIIALDVNKKEVIAFGGYNKINQIPSDQKVSAMEQYTNALTFYAPKPDDEDLEKEFYANAGSAAATYIANYLLGASVGVQIPVVFKFEYEYGDETWKMYPEGTFESKYGYTIEEYNKLLKL